MKKGIKLLISARNEQNWRTRIFFILEILDANFREKNSHSSLSSAWRMQNIWDFFTKQEKGTRKMIQKISSKKNVTFISIPTFYGTYQIIFSEVQNLLKLTESTGFWPKRAKNLLKLTELTESTIPSCISFSDTILYCYDTVLEDAKFQRSCVSYLNVSFPVYSND